jgi:multiple antibiotic resistance protein
MFGVGLSAFRIAGGVILFLVGIDMLRAQRATQERPDEVQEGVAKEDVAVTPLAIPMLAGPAAMSTVTMLINLADTPLRVCGLYTVILVVGLISYAALRLAEPLHHLLGRTGIHVISRILGLVVLAIGVQLVLDGLADVGLIKQAMTPPG